jgi:hypothetical protein
MNTIIIQCLLTSIAPHSLALTTHEFGDSLPLGQIVHERNLSSIRADLFIKWFAEHFLEHKASEQGILLFDGHRSYFSSPFLLQIAVKNNVVIIRLQGHTYIFLTAFE